MDTFAKTYLEFLQDGLDEGSKGWLVVLVSVPDVFREDGDGFRIGLGLKLVSITRSERARDGGQGVHTLAFARRGVVRQNS